MDRVGWILGIFSVPVILYIVYRIRERERINRLNKLDARTAAEMEARRIEVANRVYAARDEGW